MLALFCPSLTVWHFGSKTRISWSLLYLLLFHLMEHSSSFYSCIYFGCLTPWNVLAFNCNSQLLRWFISSLPSEFSLALNGTDLDGSLLHCTSPPKHRLSDLVLTQNMIVERSGWVVAYLVLLSAFWYGFVHSSCVFSCFLWYLLAKTSKISLALPLTALEEALFWADRCNFF